MRIVIQRVKKARVEVDDKTVGQIAVGLLLFAGVEEEDTEEDGEWLAKKVSALRIFNDDEGKMNYDLKDVDGEILVISQFTLHAKTKKGNRPSFIRAANPEKAEKLYKKFKLQLGIISGKKVQSGIFGADMQLSLINDGPVTILIDSKNKE